jgi:hypothetical protein
MVSSFDVKLHIWFNKIKINVLVAERVSNRMELATGSVLYKHWSAEPFQVIFNQPFTIGGFLDKFECFVVLFVYKMD